jgi:hypothetical protein
MYWKPETWYFWYTFFQLFQFNLKKIDMVDDSNEDLHWDINVKDI